MLANLALSKFLRDTGQHEASLRFHSLAEALNDLLEGTNNPLFKVEQIDKHAAGKRGRQPDTGETWRIRSSLCLGIQHLIAGGMNQDEAVRFVVKKHKVNLLNLLRPGADLKSSIPTWLKTFATEAIKNEVALLSYKAGMNQLRQIKTAKSKETLRQLGEKLVEGAALRASQAVKI